MADRRIDVVELETTTPNKVVRVWVSYQAGGMSYFDYKEKPRGYGATFAVIEKGPNGMESSLLGQSVGLFLEKATRFSQKKLTEWAEKVQEHPKYQETLNTCCSRCNVTIKE